MENISVSLKKIWINSLCYFSRKRVAQFEKHNFYKNDFEMFSSSFSSFPTYFRDAINCRCGASWKKFQFQQIQNTLSKWNITKPLLNNSLDSYRRNKIENIHCKTFYSGDRISFRNLKIRTFIKENRHLPRWKYFLTNMLYLWSLSCLKN